MKVDSKSKHNIQRLRVATQLRSSRDEAHLKENISSINNIEREIEELRNVTYIKLDKLTFDNSFTAYKHRNWAELRIRQLNLQLAILLVQKEKAQIKLTVSLGKSEVIKKILT